MALGVSPWRSTEWAARYLAFTDTGAPDGQPDMKRFHEWMANHVPPALRRKVGRSVRVHIDAIEPDPVRQRDAQRSRDLGD